MADAICLCEAVTERDICFFWEQLHLYHKRDIFPDPKDAEELAYFLDDEEYRTEIEKLHDRESDKLRYILFRRREDDIGFAMSVIYQSENGKCFLLEFCVFPEFRGNGTGSDCARLFLDWAKNNGARYFELNNGGSQRRARFWKRFGFYPNGADEWGNPLMLLPPDDEFPATVLPAEA